MEHTKQECIVCKKDKNTVPLLKFDYKESHFWICPQHIPVIIHDPTQLDGLIPGAGEFQAG